MKKELLKGVALGAVSTCLVLGVAYSSADANRTIMVEEGIRLELDQAPFVPRDANGNAVTPFVYNGTTYVPMRPLCEAIGFKVDYNSATNTAILTSPGGTSTNTAIITREKAKEIALDTSGVSALDAKFTKADLTDKNGAKVYDVSFTSGSKTYSYVIDAKTGKVLSSGADGQTELYITREKAKEIALDTSGISASNAKFTKADLTDKNGTKVYDVSFTSGSKTYSYVIDAKTGKILSSGTDGQTELYITREKAKEIALDTSGISASNAKFTKADLTDKNGTKVYDLSFTSGSKTYNYVIDAKTGKVLSSSTDSTTPEKPDASGYISAEKAKEIALDTAGVPASKAVFSKCKLDRDDGRAVYEVKFKSGTTEYEYEIDAKTGKVLSSDVDRDDDSSKPEPSKPSGYISQEKAKEIAISKAGVSNPQKMSCKLDEDDGHAVYEVKFTSGSTEYEYKIDAKTGKILSSDVDRDDD